MRAAETHTRLVEALNTLASSSPHLAERVEVIRTHAKAAHERKLNAKYAFEEHLRTHRCAHEP